MLLSDNAGAPDQLIAFSGIGNNTLYLANSSTMPGGGRWLSFPIGRYVAAGTYWIAVTYAGTANVDLAYDASGSDKYFTASQLLATGSYPTAWTVNSATNQRWSIRASTIVPQTNVGLGHSYVGKNAIGASSFTPVSYRMYSKKITLSQDAVIASIGVYAYESGGSAQVSSMPTVALYTDNAGTPGRLVAFSSGGDRADSWFPGNDTSPDSTDGRWTHVPLGYFATAGSYWMGVAVSDIGSLKFVYDASIGSDVYQTAGGSWLVDGSGASGVSPATTTTDDYSIRASILIAQTVVTADDPVAALLGAPDTTFEFDTSSLSGLTALGSPTTEDANTSVPGCYYVKKAAVGSNPLTGRYLTVTAPFTAIIKVVDANDAGINYLRQGQLGVLNSTPSVAQSIERFWNPSAGNGAYIWAGVSYGSLTGSPSAMTGSTDRLSTANFPFYLAVVASTTTSVSYYTSANGRVWRAHKTGVNPGFTVDKVFMSIHPENTSEDAFMAVDFLRIWNSAKTLPGGV
jgi:hypothetical protein